MQKPVRIEGVNASIAFAAVSNALRRDGSSQSVLVPLPVTEIPLVLADKLSVIRIRDREVLMARHWQSRCGWSCRKVTEVEDRGIRHGSLCRKRGTSSDAATIDGLPSKY